VSEARVRVVSGRAQWRVTMPRGIAGPLHLNAYVESDERDAAGTRTIRLVGSREPTERRVQAGSPGSSGTRWRLPPQKPAVTVARRCARPGACRS